MENSKTISILNDLLHVINDRQEGYEKVEGKIWETNHDLKNKFDHSISQNMIMKNEIINLITRRGGNPEDSATISGTLHRLWIDVKNSFLVSSLETSTLQNVIFGENAALQAYQEALDSEGLDDESRGIVGEQLKRIKDALNEFKGIAENIKS